MAYELVFFGKTGEECSWAAMDRLLDHVLEELDGSGLRLWSQPSGLTSDEDVVSWDLATRADDGSFGGDFLTVEALVGVRLLAEFVLDVDPDCEHGIWGSDLLIVIRLVGKSPDWHLVNLIWRTLADFWSMVAWDEASGFEIGNPPP